MRRHQAILAIALIGLALPCQGQSPSCADGVVISPSTPNSAQAVTVIVGMSTSPAQSPISVVATWQEGAILVTVTGSFNPSSSPPPIVCASTSIGPLPAGNYQVTLLVINTLFHTTSSGVLGTLTVTPNLSNVPGLSVAGVALLALLLSLASSFAFRRNCPR
jgi:hypothetical protein